MNTIITDPLMEPFFVSKDSHCYTVVETVESKGKSKKEYEKAIGHYSSLEGAIGKIVEAKMSLKLEYTSLQEYLTEYKTQKELLKQLINSIK